MIVEMSNVSKIYGLGTVLFYALNNVQLRIDKGEYIAIMGPSGSGKTTLLNILGGLDRPTNGKVILDEERIDNLDEKNLLPIRRRKVAHVFQEARLILSLNALENTMLPVIFSGASTGEAKMRALEMLQRVGLEKKAFHMPHQLSGGEAQRACIARMLINNPLLILADEPTGNLDSKTGLEILKLFDQLNEEGRTIVMVTHDVKVASRAKRIIQLQDGEIVEDRKQS